MLLRIMVLGALGYAGYRYFSSPRADKDAPGATPDLRIAGGPLSNDAFVVHADDELLRPSDPGRL